MSDPYFEINNESIYSAEEYEKMTEGKYGKEIFVPHDNNIDNLIWIYIERYNQLL